MRLLKRKVIDAYLYDEKFERLQSQAWIREKPVKQAGCGVFFIACHEVDLLIIRGIIVNCEDKLYTVYVDTDDMDLAIATSIKGYLGETSSGLNYIFQIHRKYLFKAK